MLYNSVFNPSFQILGWISPQPLKNKGGINFQRGVFAPPIPLGEAVKYYGPD